jgi:hypothetical protein
LCRLKHQVQKGQASFHAYKRTHRYQYYLHDKIPNLHTRLV